MYIRNTMNVIPIIVAVAVLSFAFPQVGDIVFKWIPAAASIVVGTEVPGDIRSTDVVAPIPQLQIALQPIKTDNTSMLAQAVTAFDSVVNANAYAQSPASNNIEIASRLWSIFVPISIFVSLLFIVGIIYSILQLMRIREVERSALSLNVNESPVVGGDPTRAQLRWKKIMEHSATDNPNDWRHAIIEADIMLDELLTIQGYHGDTVGDKLKQVERSDFNTIDLAWEAHKVRNRIAHEGSEHDLNAREVRRVIALYEQVLREFHFI